MPACGQFAAGRSLDLAVKSSANPVLQAAPHKWRVSATQQTSRFTWWRTHDGMAPKTRFRANFRTRPKSQKPTKSSESSRTT